MRRCFTDPYYWKNPALGRSREKHRENDDKRGWMVIQPPITKYVYINMSNMSHLEKDEHIPNQSFRPDLGWLPWPEVIKPVRV